MNVEAYVGLVSHYEHALKHGYEQLIFTEGGHDRHDMARYRAFVYYAAQLGY